MEKHGERHQTADWYLANGTQRAGEILAIIDHHYTEVGVFEPEKEQDWLTRWQILNLVDPKIAKNNFEASKLGMKAYFANIMESFQSSGEDFLEAFYYGENSIKPVWEDFLNVLQSDASFASELVQTNKFTFLAMLKLLLENEDGLRMLQFLFVVDQEAYLDLQSDSEISSFINSQAAERSNFDFGDPSEASVNLFLSDPKKLWEDDPREVLKILKSDLWKEVKEIEAVRKMILNLTREVRGKVLECFKEGGKETPFLQSLISKFKFSGAGRK